MNERIIPFFNVKPPKKSNPSVSNCDKCGLNLACRSPKMKVYGEGRLKILNIGEAPGEMEDRTGKPWQGRAGRYLQKIYDYQGIDLFKDCWNINAVNCRPTDKKGDNRAPTNQEINYCRRYVEETIKKLRPKIIVLFGFSAVQSFLGRRWNRLDSISKWRGWVIPDQTFKAFVIPVYHPSFVLREEEEGNRMIYKIWRKDMHVILLLLSKEFPIFPEPKINYIDSPEMLIKIAEHVKNSVIAIDYETTGLKPDRKGHKIVSVSFAISKYKSFSFLLTDEMKEPWKAILRDPSIKKVGHNIKYEETWSRVCLDQPVQGWLFDTMLASHVLDNRPGITGLKFQSYVRFGVEDYSSDISLYLGSKENNGNGFNKVLELLKDPSDTRKLMKYNALDTIYTYWLFDELRKEIEENENLKRAYYLLHEGVLSLCKAERTGIRVNVEKLKEQGNIIDKRIEKYEKLFKQSSLYSEWQRNSEKEVNINSTTQLSYFLYKVKKITPPQETPTCKGSTDEKTLLSLNIPELKYLVSIRKLKKIRTTYLERFLEEQVEGILHPSFNLHLVTTYRSSSDHPNFQNIPKRDKQAMEITRGCLFPRPGHLILEADYSSLEVRIAACYHKDPVMIKYLKDPSSDMHADIAKEIFLLDKLDKSDSGHKFLRYLAKNGFVFPQFYGSYYKNCASNIAIIQGKLSQSKWKKGQGIDLGGYTISDLLISKGISSYNAFEEHLKKVEDRFWNKKFVVYRDWKERWWNDYLKKGYIEMYTGFQCKGPMYKNDCINYPIQGSAFHCLLWSFNRLTTIFEEKKWKSRLIGQIHDSIIVDVDPSELHEIVKTIKRITCEELPQEWKWINVPLDIEFEATEINSPWSDKKELKL